MNACASCRQSFIVPCETSKARHPGQTALDYPAARQRPKAFLGLGQPHDFEVQAMGPRILRGLSTGVPVIDKRHFDRVTGDGLHVFSPPLPAPAPVRSPP